MDPGASEASVLRACPQCGARVSFPPERLSDRCAFCDNPLVAHAGSAARVDLVAPFDVARTAAGERLRRYLQDHRFAPEAVRQARPDDLEPVFVPFWTWDATARTTYRARVGLWWYRTETYWVTVNGKRQRRTRRVRETEWFPVSGTHVHAYQDHLTSGSRGLPEAESNALEPFDLGRALPFAPERVAGVVAEQPTVDHAEAARVAAQELAELENREIRRFLPADEVADVRNETEMEVGAVRLVLLPVWIATTTASGKLLRLLVNGQTGEVVGKVPISAAKVAFLVLAVLLVAAAVVGAVMLAGEVS